MPKLLCIWLILLTGSACLAQPYDENNFLHYTTREGLSNNYISGIVQDSTGFMWISTGHGLNRFDGNGFKQFLHSNENNSIPDNAIFTLQLLPHDQLGIATDD